MAKRKQSRQEKALRRYFRSRPTSSVRMLVLGIVLFAAGLLLADATAGASLLPGVILLFLGLAGIFRALFRSRPSDAKVDRWLDEGIDRLTKQSLSKLGLDENQTISDPLIIAGPVLWTTYGIEDEDLVWREGKDGLVRFGVYGVSVVQFTDHHLGAFTCDYNFLKDVPLNETTEEYHYQDIVAVSTKELATSYTLPSRQKLTSAQMFRISATSGDAIEVVVGLGKLDDDFGTLRLPGTETEKAIATVRAMLRDKKQP